MLICRPELVPPIDEANVHEASAPKAPLPAVCFKHQRPVATNSYHSLTAPANGKQKLHELVPTSVLSPPHAMLNLELESSGQKHCLEGMLQSFELLLRTSLYHVVGTLLAHVLVP